MEKEANHYIIFIIGWIFGFLVGNQEFTNKLIKIITLGLFNPLKAPKKLSDKK